MCVPKNSKLTDWTEKQIEQVKRQMDGNLDNYNDPNKIPLELDEYIRRLKGANSLQYSYAPGEKMSDYYKRLLIFNKLRADKNYDVHVVNKNRGPWFTHLDKFGMGCFMCEDNNFAYYLMQLLGYFCQKYPDETIS